MISDIQSMLNASSGKQSNGASSGNNVLGSTGTIAKLSSEIKLIENLSLIKFQGSESLNFQGKPAQLLHATSAQHPFTLVNTGTPIDVNNIQNAKLHKSNGLQASLTMPLDTQTSKIATNNPNIPQIRQADNLMLASRVVNLTVTAVAPSATATQAQGPTPLTPLQAPPYQANATPHIQASVTSPSNTTITSHTSPILATVSDGNTEFPIVSQTPLKKGDVVRVMVDANNNMQVLPAKNHPAPNSIQVEALKHSLPKQLSFGDMSQLVRQLHALNETSSANLPPQTQQALKQLMQNMPTLGTLTTSPEAMKQAIQTSGLFSESLLANDSKTQIPADLKLNLMQLKDAQENSAALRLTGVPTEHIASAIERITTNQLRHVSDQNQINGPSYPLHIELPIKNGQTPSFVRMEIDKDAATEEQAKQDRRWLVKLKFDFEETGRFDARASVQANKVGILFAAEESDTVQKLRQNIPSLKQQLKDKDIEVERLEAFQAKLEKEKSHINNTQSLIDVRT